MEQNSNIHMCVLTSHEEDVEDGWRVKRSGVEWSEAEYRLIEKERVKGVLREGKRKMIDRLDGLIFFLLDGQMSEWVLSLVCPPLCDSNLTWLCCHCLRVRVRVRVSACFTWYVVEWVVTPLHRLGIWVHEGVHDWLHSKFDENLCRFLYE